MADPDGSREAPSHEAREAAPANDQDDASLKAVLEIALFSANQPVTERDLAAKLGQDYNQIARLLASLIQEYEQPHHGVRIQAVAGGYRVTTKPEHHEFLKAFLQKQNAVPPLTTQALETLALIALKQPISAPEINDIRGVRGAGTLKTLLHRKLIARVSRKDRPGRAALYKTTRQFLIEFGLNRVDELFTSERFAEILRLPPGLGVQKARQS